jgi:hypothetical protein
MWIAPAAAVSWPAPARFSADGDKYKVTDDGDMKAQAIWRENRALPAKTATGLSPGKNAPLFGLYIF